MCRIAAYAGPDATLGSILYDPEHSLEHQAYAPRELVHGTVNVDGTGVAWWDGRAPEPLRYVSASSPWADTNLPVLSRRLESRMILAAVRSATPGLAHGPDQVSPFVSGRLAGAHNGWIQGFRGPVGRALVAELPDGEWSDLGVLNDSKALFLTVAAMYEGDLVEAVRAALERITRIVSAEAAAATLNLVAADGDRIVAARYSIGAPFNSLYVASRGDAHLVASEPLDDGPEWKPVPEGHLVAVTESTFESRDLELR